MGTGRRHQRVRHPDVYCLSLDVVGPFRSKSVDPNHNDYRYFLVGAYTMPGDPNPEVPHEEPHGDPKPEVPHEEPHGDPEPEVPHEEPHGDPQRDDAEEPWYAIDESWERRESPPKGDPALKGLTEEEEFNKIFSEVGEPRDVKVLYYVLPLRRRTSAQVLATVQNMVLRLKSQGLLLQRVHSDRARELRTEPLKRWLLQHGALSTYTEGQRPQQNGARRSGRQAVEERCSLVVGVNPAFREPAGPLQVSMRQQRKEVGCWVWMLHHSPMARRSI